MNIRLLVILQLAGFLPRGTLGHRDSLVTVNDDEWAGRGERGWGSGPLDRWIGNA